MKIAIPLLGDRVAPHFGSSSKILQVEIEGNRLTKEVVSDISEKGAMKTARRLVEMGVEQVVCGGIQSIYKEWLISKGVKVLDNQKGAAAEVVRKLLESQG
jgi:predicted Fe-Mo cluster-binding NifX family protein